MAFSQDILLWQNTPEKKNTIKEAVKWKTLCYTFKNIKYMVVVSYFYRTIGTWWVMWGISQHLHLLSSTLSWFSMYAGLTWRPLWRSTSVGQWCPDHRAVRHPCQPVNIPSWLKALVSSCWYFIIIIMWSSSSAISILFTLYNIF